MFLQSQLSGRVLKSMYSCGRGLMLQEHSVDHQITGKHCIHMHCTVNLDERKKNLFYLIMWIKLSCLWLPFADISRISKLNFCQMEEIRVPVLQRSYTGTIQDFLMWFFLISVKRFLISFLNVFIIFSIFFLSICTIDNWYNWYLWIILKLINQICMKKY